MRTRGEGARETLEEKTPSRTSEREAGGVDELKETARGGAGGRKALAETKCQQ